MADEIINKVEKSGLITIDLEKFYPKGERVEVDIKDHLWEGMALREKDFREFVSTTNWTEYQDKFVAIYCSADAIVPTWAYMLVASALQPFAAKVVFGDLEVLETILFDEALRNVNTDDFKDARVVIKGCGDIAIPDAAYVQLTGLLQPVAKSIMFGEPCSTVPIYKKKREQN